MTNRRGRRERPTKRDHIRALLLHPEESYALREVAHLADMPVATLRRDVRAGHRDASKQRGTWRFTWQQAALVAFSRWTLAEVHDALGAVAATALPPLLALRSVTVELPEYILRGLEACAADRRMPFDHYLYWELIEFAGALPQRFVRQIPGFQEAYLFPGRTVSRAQRD